MVGSLGAGLGIEIMFALSTRSHSTQRAKSADTAENYR